MRWDRLFGELEGLAEHERLAERDALVADLREGEWAERSWIDGLAGVPTPIEVSVRDVGVLAGVVQWASRHVIALATTAAVHLVAVPAVLWVRGADRSPGLATGSVRAELGWGPVLREARDERDVLTVTLLGASTYAGTVAAVGRDFVRLRSTIGHDRDIPTAAIALITFSR
jgi:hypothetical protein